jgi:hypothetical protein
MPKRPEWWDWDIELSTHALERMGDRDFTELDVRRMFDAAIAVRRSDWPRWEIHTRLRGSPWRMIVELDIQRYVVNVITAHPLNT